MLTEILGIVYARIREDGKDVSDIQGIYAPCEYEILKLPSNASFDVIIKLKDGSESTVSIAKSELNIEEVNNNEQQE